MNIRLTPKIGFVILNYSVISDYQRKVLDMLYQPILGSISYSLINLMWRINQNNKYNEQLPHFNLLSLLKVDMRTFYKARLKLEGAGLLRVLYKVTDSQPLYVYQLLAPLSAQNFFNNDLLSVALLEIIGDDLYKRLKQQLIPKKASIKNAHDITKNFLEVYNINSNNIDYNSKNKNLNNHNNSYNKKKTVQSNDFDFKLLLEMLKSTYSNINQIKKFYNLILSEHRIYGIDEITTANLIKKSTNLINNNFKPEQFKILVSNMFKNSSRQNNQINNSYKKYNSQDFTDEQKALFHSTKVYPPIQFLNNLKSQLGSFITRDDEFAIRDVTNRSNFSNEIINMLIYHILIDMNNSSLNTSLIEKIASNWQQNHVNSAEDAYLAIKNYDKKRINKQNSYKNKKYNNSNNSSKHIKEKLPDWARKDYKPKYKKVNLSEQKKAKDRLRKLQNKLRNKRGGK